MIYLSNQSDDQRPRTLKLMSHGGKFAEAAVVAAPSQKLYPANSLESRAPLQIRSLVSLVSFSRAKKLPDTYVKRGPESEDRGLKFRYATIAEMGHKGDFVFPMTMVCPCLKGSVLDTFNRTCIYWGEFLGIKVMSLFVRWCFGSKVQLQVSSPTCRKPKKARVIAAQNFLVKWTLLLISCENKRPWLS